VYGLFETAEFIRSLDGLPKGNSAFVRQKLSEYVYPQLRQQPQFGPNIKKLRGYVPATWRYRIGRYRIFYMIDEDDGTVLLLTIDHRKDAYK